MVDKRKHRIIFSEINRKNNGARRRKAARNRKPCTLASLLLKAVRSTCKNLNAIGFNFLLFVSFGGWVRSQLKYCFCGKRGITKPGLDYIILNINRRNQIPWWILEYVLNYYYYYYYYYGSFQHKKSPRTKHNLPQENTLTTVATKAKRFFTPNWPISDRRIAVRTWSDFKPPFFCLFFGAVESFITSSFVTSLLLLCSLQWPNKPRLLTLNLDCIYAAVPPAIKIPDASSIAFLSVTTWRKHQQ